MRSNKEILEIGTWKGQSKNSRNQRNRTIGDTNFKITEVNQRPIQVSELVGKSAAVLIIEYNGFNHELALVNWIKQNSPEIPIYVGIKYNKPRGESKAESNRKCKIIMDNLSLNENNYFRINTSKEESPETHKKYHDFLNNRRIEMRSQSEILSDNHNEVVRAAQINNDRRLRNRSYSIAAGGGMKGTLTRTVSFTTSKIKDLGGDIKSGAETIGDKVKDISVRRQSTVVAPATQTSTIKAEASHSGNEQFSNSKKQWRYTIAPYTPEAMKELMTQFLLTDVQKLSMASLIETSLDAKYSKRDDSFRGEGFKNIIEACGLCLEGYFNMFQRQKGDTQLMNCFAEKLVDVLVKERLATADIKEGTLSLTVPIESFPMATLKLESVKLVHNVFNERKLD